jgi:CHAT domain-containing protein/Flp pilus assembly protein TadD
MFTSILNRARPSRHFLPLTRLGFQLLLTLSLLTPTRAAQSEKEIHQLELNKPVERELAGGQAHSYQLALAADQYLHVVADQRGIDVVVTLFSPDGKQLVEVDSPNGTQGPETISAMAEATGTYRLEVRSLEKDAPAGRYEVKIVELRKATEQDKTGIAADRAFMQAKLLYEQGTVESLRSAIKKYEEALPLYRAVRDRRNESTALHNTGYIYYLLGEKQKALEYYAQVLPLLRAIGDRGGEATTLSNIGKVYSSLGEIQKALDYYRQALEFRRALGDRDGEAMTLSEIGRAYDDLDERQKALNYYEQALPLYRAVGDRDGEAAVLNGIGAVYQSLGERQRALEDYAQALQLTRAVRNVRGEATTLGNIGVVYQSLGESQKALDYFARALALRRATGDRGGEAGTLQNIGAVYYLLGEYQKALDYYGQALPLVRAVGDRNGEAAILSNIGVAYGLLGDKRNTLDHFAQALPLSCAIGDRPGEATTLNNLMFAYAGAKSPRLAVLYGKQAVNAYQQLRSNIQGLDKDVQKTYLKSVEQAYRELANLLLTQDRSAEAQQVLNAFKDQQFFDFDRTTSRQLKPLARTPREEEFTVRYQKISDALVAIGGQVAGLNRKLGPRAPNAEEARQLQQLEAQLKSASDEFSTLLKQAEAEFSQPADEQDRVGEVSDTTQMQATLRRLRKETGQTAVAVYTLVGEEKFYALVVTADDIASVSSAITGDELNKKARALWGLLQSDAYDPNALSNELYHVVFKPIKEKLPADTKTILWSLDGNLRYVPMAALYDGKRYLVELYDHVNFTRADGERMTRAVTHDWTATGLGTSAAHTVKLLGSNIPLGALPGVGEELRLLVRRRENPRGLFDGETLQDAQFTRAAMLSALKRKRPLVHIASHFAFRPGDEERSFLLVGDGTAFTLAEMKQQGRLFDGVELLTLSACNTAAQQAGANGREVDAFAEFAQRLGADAVMATLWPVADGSTPWLMREFYQTRQKQALNKAEALRRAQRALLKGSAGAVKTGADTRAAIVSVDVRNALPFKKDPRRPFAHPYYWSPFILIGNWR